MKDLTIITNSYFRHTNTVSGIYFCGCLSHSACTIQLDFAPVDIPQIFTPDVFSFTFFYEYIYIKEELRCWLQGVTAWRAVGRGPSGPVADRLTLHYHHQRHREADLMLGLNGRSGGTHCEPVASTNSAHPKSKWNYVFCRHDVNPTTA